MAFASLTGGQLERWNEATAGSTVATATTGFLLVEDFLNSSGQIALALQGQTLEQQVRHSFNYCSHLLPLMQSDLIFTGLKNRLNLIELDLIPSYLDSYRLSSLVW